MKLVLLTGKEAENIQKIFCINVFYFSKPGIWERSRCWGWFPTFKEAEQCIMENWCDIYEYGYYNVALIEEVPAGVPGIPPVEHWYAVDFDGENDKYVIEKIDKPEKLSGIRCFSFH